MESKAAASIGVRRIQKYVEREAQRERPDADRDPDHTSGQQSAQ